jgi:hypothetical protein
MSCRRQNLEVSDEVKDRLLQYYSGASGADGTTQRSIGVSCLCVPLSIRLVGPCQSCSRFVKTGAVWRGARLQNINTHTRADTTFTAFLLAPSRGQVKIFRTPRVG